MDVSAAMDSSGITQTVIQWAVIVMVATPLITIILGEVLDRLRRRGTGNFVPFIRVLQVYVVPAVVIYVVAKYIFGLDAPQADADGNLGHSALYAFILSGLYLVLAYAAYAFMRGLNANRDPKSWESRIPGLFKAVLMALVFVAPIIMLLDAWGIKLGNFARYAALAAAAVGLALQDALSSVTKGFLLVLDKPFAVGDWIEVDGVKGKVLDISWRSTRLQVAGNDIVVIPNLIISDNSVYNYTAEDISYRDDITLGFSYDDPPNTVKAILRGVLEDCDDVVKVPAPQVFTVSYDDFSIGYRCYFFIKEYVSAMDQERVRDDIMNRIWYAADRGGISIPFPIQVEAPPSAFARDISAIKDGVAAFLGDNPYFAPLDKDSLTRLADVAEIAPFADGETIFNAGDIAETLDLVRKGSVRLVNASARPRHLKTPANDLDVVGMGGAVGEFALMGRRAQKHTAIARGDTEIIRLPPGVLNPIIEAHPKFARLLNTLVETGLQRGTEAGSDRGTDIGKDRGAGKTGARS